MSDIATSAVPQTTILLNKSKSLSASYPYKARSHNNSNSSTKSNGSNQTNLWAKEASGNFRITCPRLFKGSLSQNSGDRNSLGLERVRKLTEECSQKHEDTNENEEGAPIQNQNEIPKEHDTKKDGRPPTRKPSSHFSHKSSSTSSKETNQAEITNTTQISKCQPRPLSPMSSLKNEPLEHRHACACPCPCASPYACPCECLCPCPKTCTACTKLHRNYLPVFYHGNISSPDYCNSRNKSHSASAFLLCNHFWHSIYPQTPHSLCSMDRDKNTERALKEYNCAQEAQTAETAELTVTFAHAAVQTKTSTMRSRKPKPRVFDAGKNEFYQPATRASSALRLNPLEMPIIKLLPKPPPVKVPKLPLKPRIQQGKQSKKSKSYVSLDRTKSKSNSKAKIIPTQNKTGPLTETGMLALLRILPNEDLKLSNSTSTSGKSTTPAMNKLTLGSPRRGNPPAPAPASTFDGNTTKEHSRSHNHHHTKSQNKFKLERVRSVSYDSNLSEVDPIVFNPSKSNKDKATTTKSSSAARDSGHHHKDPFTYKTLIIKSDSKGGDETKLKFSKKSDQGGDGLHDTTIQIQNSNSNHHSLVDSEFKKLRALHLPIVWVYGYTQLAVTHARRDVVNQLARERDYYIMNLDYQIQRLQNFNHVVAGNRNKQLTAHVESRVGTIMGKLFPHNERESASLSAHDICDIYKISILISHLEKFPPKGYIIDAFPLDLDEGQVFEQMIWPCSLGLYFLSESWVETKSVRPTCVQPKYFVRSNDYLEDDVEAAVDFYGFKSIKITYAEKLKGDVQEHFMQFMMEILIKNSLESEIH